MQQRVVTQTMAPRRPLTEEKPIHAKAFELYAAQVGRRSYAKVAAALDVAVGSVKNWAVDFHWQARIAERDVANARRVADQVFGSQDEELAFYLKASDAVLKKILKGILDGTVKPTAADAERFIRLRMTLAGDPNGAGVTFMSTPEEIWEFLKTLSTWTWNRVWELVAKDQEEHAKRESELLIDAPDPASQIDRS